MLLKNLRYIFANIEEVNIYNVLFKVKREQICYPGNKDKIFLDHFNVSICHQLYIITFIY